MKQAYTEDEIASSMNWIWRAIRADLNEEQKNSIKTVLENPARKMKLIQFLVWAQFHEWEPDSIWLDVLREFMFRYDMIPPLFKEVHLSILSHDLREGLTNGVECEVCGQFCREYKRSLNSNMMVFLRSLIKLSVGDKVAGGKGWIHHKELTYTGRDYTLTQYWGLAETGKAEPDENGAQKKRTSGYWRPTELGIKFIRGEVKLPRSIYMYNGETRPDSEASLVSFEDALGEPFVYSELFHYPNG